MTVTPLELRSAEASALRAELAAVGPTNALDVVTRLRRQFPNIEAELVSAVVTQAELARRGERRLGSWAHDMVLEPIALEQATRRDVARYRARQLIGRLGLEHPRVADLGCGIGVDARALAEAGCEVTVVDRDPWRCAAAVLNAELSGAVHTLCADVRDVNLSNVDAAFVDPARRTPNAPRSIDGTRSTKEVDPASWSPPWPWVVQTSKALPLAAKASTGLPISAVPVNAEVEWIDHDGDTVEACVWFAPLASTRKRATVVPADPSQQAESLVASADSPAPVAASIQAFLVEPTPAVRRAGLVDELAHRFDLHRLRSDSHWLTTDTVPATQLARAWSVVAELPTQAKALRAALADRGPVTWKTNDVPVSAVEQQRRVRHQPVRGAEPTHVVLAAGGIVVEVTPT